jgi:hypothetical protein
MTSLRVRFVYYQILSALLTLSGKYLGVAGVWHEAVTRSFVNDHISQLRTKLTIAACERHLVRLTADQRAEVIALLAERDPDLHLAFRLYFADLAPTLVALCVLMISGVGCASDAAHSCAFSATAQYTMAAPMTEPQTNTLVCLWGGEQCAESAYTCDGDVFTFANPRFPDRKFSYTVVSSNADGIDADFRDLSAMSMTRVHLQEQ